MSETKHTERGKSGGGKEERRGGNETKTNEAGERGEEGRREEEEGGEGRRAFTKPGLHSRMSRLPLHHPQPPPPGQLTHRC